jgi:hypothetical protein
VDDVVIVRTRKGLTDLKAHVHHVQGAELPAVYELPKVRPLHELEREVPDVTDRTEVQEACDVGVIELLYDAGFVQQGLHRHVSMRRVGRVVLAPEDLETHQLARSGALERTRGKGFADQAPAKLADQLVAAQLSSRHQ